jgi:predicted PurR-regulated permease PerM
VTTSTGGLPQKTQPDRSSDLVRTTFRLLALGALILTSFWIVRPFLMASAWATMIAIATWPLLLQVEGWLGGRRSLAVAVMTTALLVLLVMPFYFGVTTIVEHAGQIADWSKTVASYAVAGPPAWIEALPLVGAPLADQWRRFAASPQDVSAAVEPFVQGLVLWFGSQIGSVGLLLLQLALTVVVVALLYANGETAARGADRFAGRLAGPQGREALQLAARAVRAVALGVVVTAIVQSGLVGIGLAIVGVPYVTILVALVFVLAIAQLGPVLVLLPTAVWVYQTSGAVWGTGFAVWAALCSVLDNLLRPVLIKRGADLPLLLIFAGVVGGLIGFGVIGLFVGPMVLAVAYTLVVDWVADDEAAGETGGVAT